MTMTILCHCRAISDKDLTQAFEKVREDEPERALNLEDLTPHLGDFKCGGCKRIFERAAQQFNDTGEINLFRRSKGANKSDNENGLCTHARNNKYGSNGVPDLLSPAIDGEPK